MDDSPSSPNLISARVRQARRSPTGMPRWVKVLLIIAVILVLLFVILHLTGNGFGDHMHMSAIPALPDRPYGVSL